MTGGYMGKLLCVDLANRTTAVELLDEKLCRQYIGGYGLGARLLYERIPAKVDALGPQNILGFLTGPLTGTPSIIGSRWVAVGKSPRTGGWGDANAGGQWGPTLKFAGFDGILFDGVASSPVCLVIEDGKAEIRDAQDIWGKNVYEVEDLLKARHGQKAEIATIGTAGERLALLACIVTDKGRAAGRSGLGAVMGSKKLKAIVVKGSQEVPVYDPERMRQQRQAYNRDKSQQAYTDFHNYGTVAGAAAAAMNGDSPVKNWGGSSVDFPLHRAEKISDDAVVALQKKRYGCWKCPVACGGTVSVESGPYALRESEGFRGHKPEYETVGSFGMMALNDNLESLIKVTEICNDFGLDTISVGSTISFAIECYENRLISKEDTGGIELHWGDHQAIVAMTEKLARREGLGAVLADGVWAASAKIGPQSKPFAMHVHGEELPMHDSRFTPTLATSYILDATPGRHTQASRLIVPPGLDLPKAEKYQASGQAEAHRTLIGINHVMQSAGLCLLGYLVYPVASVPEQLSAVTGWDITMDEVITTGLRINTMRHAFNLREGLNPLHYEIPGRMVGQPPLKDGALAGVTIDYQTQIAELLDALGWDRATTVPLLDTLMTLDMEFLADDLTALRSASGLA